MAMTLDEGRTYGFFVDTTAPASALAEEAAKGVRPALALIAVGIAKAVAQMDPENLVRLVEAAGKAKDGKIHMEIQVSA